MHLAVVSSRSAEGKVALLVNEKHIELIAHKLPCKGCARDAAADYKHLHPAAFERRIIKERQMHFFVLRLGTVDVVYDVRRRIRRCGKLTRSDCLLPCRELSTQNDAAVFE